MKYLHNVMVFFHVIFVAILLGSIKVPYEEIKRRIIEMDEDQLTPQIIEQLIKYMPQPAQMSQLAELKAEYKTMAEPEQFGVVVSTAHTHTHTHTHTHIVHATTCTDESACRTQG